MMATEIKRRGSIIYIREPHIFKTITPRLKKIEKKLEYIEKKGEKLIHEEERKKRGIIPKVLRFGEKIEKKFGKGEEEFARASQLMRIRQMQLEVNNFLKTIRGMDYLQLLDKLKSLNKEYDYVKKSQAEIKRKKITLDEKLWALIEQEQPMGKDEMKAFENAHSVMKKSLLENILKKERQIKKLGKII
jgi:hypothetical protein